MAASLYRWSLILTISIACLATFKCVTEPKEAPKPAPPAQVDTSKYPDIEPPRPQ